MSNLVRHRVYIEDHRWYVWIYDTPKNVDHEYLLGKATFRQQWLRGVFGHTPRWVVRRANDVIYDVLQRINPESRTMKRTRQRVRMIVRLLLLAIITFSAIVMASSQGGGAYTGYLTADCNNPRLIADITGSKRSVEKEIKEDGWKYSKSETTKNGLSKYYTSNGGDVFIAMFDGSTTRALSVFVSSPSRSDATSTVDKIKEQLAEAYGPPDESGSYYTTCSSYYLFVSCQYIYKEGNHFIAMMMAKIPFE